MSNLYNISENPQWNLALNYLADDSLSEVEANGPKGFFVKQNGKRFFAEDVSFDDDASYATSIEVGLVPLVTSWEEFKQHGYIFEGPIRYYVGDKEIRGRCHIVLPPAADVPQVTIAKKSTSLVTLDAIAEKGSMPTEILHFAKLVADADLTTVISGGTGAGKTTFLEAFSKLFANDMRIGVAEDTPELELVQPNVTYLHSVPWRPGMDEKDVASLSWVVAQFNRMRTDKLIVGETRGKEFADFLVAANSGMEGSLTTLHANDPSKALEKMTIFALRGSPNQPINSINKDIASSIDIVFQLAYFKSDSRYRVTAVQEITSTVANNESAGITTNRLYTYNPTDDTWTKKANPTDELRNKFEERGVSLSRILDTPPGSVLRPTGGSGGFSGGSGLPTRRV